jgi:hypothetical protein
VSHLAQLAPLASASGAAVIFTTIACALALMVWLLRADR